ncbi:uncharacterized protein [Primulina huaijiensis]|uniref:uncharacterized protein n=1 Tax=Primulina huaijiensis TaxID=1492673 RepID=UPI003CC78947
MPPILVLRFTVHRCSGLGKHGNKMQLDDGTCIFLYQLVGTWGQLLFPRPWKEFRLCIYTNFLHERALSISHRDPGVNYWKTAGPDSYLVDENYSDFSLLKLYPLNELKWYDFCFRKVLTNRIVDSSRNLGPILQSVQNDKSFILVSLYRVHEAVIRNMVGHFEKLDVRNYVFVGPMSHVLLDLARRGHPVIDASHFSEVNNLAKSITFQDSTAELVKEILVSAYVTRKSLDLGYNIWVLEENMLPRTGDSFYDSFVSANDVFIGKTTGLLFVRSSSLTLKIWFDDFVDKIVSLFDALLKDSVTHDRIMLDMVEKLLEQQRIKFDDIDALHLGLSLGIVHANSTTSFRTENKFVYWSSETKLDIIQRQLEHLDMWVIDGDFSCVGVFFTRHRI